MCADSKLRCTIRANRRHSIGRRSSIIDPFIDIIIIKKRNRCCEYMVIVSWLQWSTTVPSCDAAVERVGFYRADVRLEAHTYPFRISFVNTQNVGANVSPSTIKINRRQIVSHLHRQPSPSSPRGHRRQTIPRSRGAYLCSSTSTLFCSSPRTFVRRYAAHAFTDLHYIYNLFII